MAESGDIGNSVAEGESRVELVVAVLWRRRDGGAERCRLERMGRGWRLNGVVLAPTAGAPVEARYVVTTDGEWRTEAAHVVVIGPRETRRLHLIHEATGWQLNGVPRPDLAGCVDVDLGLSPSTNTLAIRRLGLDPGGAADILAAWVRFPELDVVPMVQHYRRDGDGDYTYASGSFEAGVRVDDQGLVVDYGEWSSVARSN